MTEGVMGGGALQGEATLGPDGVWRGTLSNEERWLNSHFPVSLYPGPGYPWVRTFHDAAVTLGAEIIQAPEPPAPDPNTLY